MRKQLIAVGIGFGLMALFGAWGEAGSRGGARVVAPAQKVRAASAVKNVESDVHFTRKSIDSNQDLVTIQDKLYKVPAQLNLVPAYVGQDASGQVVILTQTEIKGVPESSVSIINPVSNVDPGVMPNPDPGVKPVSNVDPGVKPLY